LVPAKIVTANETLEFFTEKLIVITREAKKNKNYEKEMRIVLYLLVTLSLIET
jgi:hypothetical protein